MQYTTVDDILSKLSSEYPIQEELNEGDVSRWCKEAMRMIDNYSQWEKKSIVATIVDYKTLLPGDFQSMDWKESNPAVRVQGSYLYFSSKTGTKTIHYLAMPLDEQGRPFIPDTEEYKDAFTHYCASKLCKSRVILPTEDINYEKEHDKWLQKKFEARADTHLSQGLPSLDKTAKNFHSLTSGLNRYFGSRR